MPTTTEVGNILGSSSRDIGELCTHSNITMWSRCKPVRDGRISVPLNEVGKGSDNKWGLNIPSYVNGSYPMTTYNRPRGGGEFSEPYRIGDFRGYYHGNFTPPITIGTKPAQIETSDAGANGVIYASSMISPGAPLVTLMDLGLRLCAMFYISSNQQFLGWASAPSDSTGSYGEGYVAYQLSSMITTLDIKFGLVSAYQPWTTNLPAVPMWELPRQFPGQNSDWLGVPLVLGAQSISNFGVTGHLSVQEMRYSITANYSFLARIEVLEEGRTTGLFYNTGNTISVVANTVKTGTITQVQLPFPLVSGKVYTTNIYDGSTLKFSRQMIGPA